MKNCWLVLCALTLATANLFGAAALIPDETIGAASITAVTGEFNEQVDGSESEWAELVFQFTNENNFPAPVPYIGTLGTSIDVRFDLEMSNDSGVLTTWSDQQVQFEIGDGAPNVRGWSTDSIDPDGNVMWSLLNVKYRRSTSLGWTGYSSESDIDLSTSASAPIIDIHLDTDKDTGEDPTYFIDRTPANQTDEKWEVYFDWFPYKDKITPTVVYRKPPAAGEFANMVTRIEYKVTESLDSNGDPTGTVFDSGTRQSEAYNWVDSFDVDNVALNGSGELELYVSVRFSRGNSSVADKWSDWHTLLIKIEEDDH